MNPVDHPLGGGEGKSSGGRHPVSPWGKPEGRTLVPQQEVQRNDRAPTSYPRRAAIGEGLRSHAA